MQNLRASLAALSAVSGLSIDFPGGDGAAADEGNPVPRGSPVRDLRSLGEFLDEPPLAGHADGYPGDGHEHGHEHGHGSGDVYEGLDALQSDSEPLDDESRFIAALATRYGLSADAPAGGKGSPGPGASASPLRSPERSASSAHPQSFAINNILPGISGPSREAIDDLLRDSGLDPLPKGPQGDSPPAMRAALAEALHQLAQRGRLVQAQQGNVQEARSRAARAESEASRLLGALEQSREDFRAAQQQAQLASEASAAGGKAAAEMRRRLDEERSAAAHRSKHLEHLVREREVQIQRLTDRLEDKVRREERRSAAALKAFERLRSAAALGGRAGAAAAAAVVREVSPLEIVATLEEERAQREEEIAALRREVRCWIHECSAILLLFSLDVSALFCEALDACLTKFLRLARCSEPG